MDEGLLRVDSVTDTIEVGVCRYGLDTQQE